MLSRQSPVDVVIAIRKDLEEFQHAGGKQELRAALREALMAAGRAGVADGSPSYDPAPDGSWTRLPEEFWKTRPPTHPQCSLFVLQLRAETRA